MKQPLFCIAILTAFVFSPTVLTLAQNPPKDSSAATEKVGVKNVEVSEAAKLLKESKEIIVLDVRTPKEYADSRIAGAKNIDFNGADFERKLGALDKEKTYLVHCAVGARSAKARELMKKLRFQSVYHLEGGLRAWEKAGQPLER